MHHIKTLLIKFNSGNFKIIESNLDKAGVEKHYKETKRDAVFVSIDREDTDMRTDSCPPVQYSIYDAGAKKEMKNKGHLVVTTRSNVGALKDVMEVTNTAGLQTLQHLLCRDPHTVARVIRELEKRFVRYTDKEKSIFTDHSRSDTFFYGLAYTLIMLGITK